MGTLQRNQRRPLLPDQAMKIPAKIMTCSSTGDIRDGMVVGHQHMRFLGRMGEVAVMALALAIVTGCEDEAPPPPAKPQLAAEPAQAAPAAAVAAPQPEAPVVYTYNAVGKRDPFRTYFAELDEVDDQVKTQTELQRFDIDQLKLVGVIVGTATPIAMVEDPAGMGHVVRVGTLMGKHWGQVKHIRRGEIIIQEEFRDFTGRRVSHLVPLKIPDEGLGMLQAN